MPAILGAWLGWLYLPQPTWILDSETKMVRKQQSSAIIATDLGESLTYMVRGAVRMGAYIPSQLGINRPHPLLSGTRTPVEGLYLCGSSTGNGGGINGAPGYIAANAIADDLQLERPWTRVAAPEWRH